jgi:monofunctional biosynthetic peptidoglycan transglycosylase
VRLPRRGAPGIFVRHVQTLIRRLLRLLAIAILAIVGLWLLLIVAYRWIDPPGTPLMLLRYPEEGRLDYRFRAINHIPPALARAVIASEDQRFCLHRGVDWDAVEDAIDEYEERGRLRGASTITMQTARNLFLWPGGGFFRKGLEVGLAYLIELAWPKRRIMEVYLNIAEWGHGLYGAEAAAQAHFGKPADRLTQREAALLAAVLPNPRRFDAGKPSAYVARRAATIDGRVPRLHSFVTCLRRS